MSGTNKHDKKLFNFLTMKTGWNNRQGWVHLGGLTIDQDGRTEYQNENQKIKVPVFLLVFAYDSMFPHL